MTWVKVCGLTRHEDVATAISAGADAIGFVLADDSPRRVSLAMAAELASSVSGATRVLVTLDMPATDLMDAVAVTGVDGVQPAGLHAADAAATATEAGLVVLRPVAVRVEDITVDLAAVPAAEIPLLDTKVPGISGGTGRTFDWAAATGIARRFVLAGGLGADNVAEAIASIAPWGVDASSRLEVEAGIKDPGKVTAFVREAKRV